MTWAVVRRLPDQRRHKRHYIVHVLGASRTSLFTDSARSVRPSIVLGAFIGGAVQLRFLLADVSIGSLDFAFYHQALNPYLIALLIFDLLMTAVSLVSLCWPRTGLTRPKKTPSGAHAGRRGVI